MLRDISRGYGEKDTRHNELFSGVRDSWRIDGVRENVERFTTYRERCFI